MAHLHTALWQHNQFSDVSVYLTVPANSCALVVDFCENYTCM